MNASQVADTCKNSKTIIADEEMAYATVDAFAYAGAMA